MSTAAHCPVCHCCCTFMRDVCVWAYKAKHRCVHWLILLILFLALLRGRICPLLRQTNGGFGRVLFLQCVGFWWFYYLEFSKYVAWSNVTQKQIVVVGSGRQSRGIRKLWHMSQGWPQTWHTATRIRHVLTKCILYKNNRSQQSLLGGDITLRCGRLIRGLSPARWKRFFKMKIPKRLWAHCSSCSVCTGAVSLLVKWPGCDADHSGLSGAEINP